MQQECLPQFTRWKILDARPDSATTMRAGAPRPLPGYIRRPFAHFLQISFLPLSHQNITTTTPLHHFDTPPPPHLYTSTALLPLLPSTSTTLGTVSASTTHFDIAIALVDHNSCLGTPSQKISTPISSSSITSLSSSSHRLAPALLSASHRSARLTLLQPPETVGITVDVCKPSTLMSLGFVYTFC